VGESAFERVTDALTAYGCRSRGDKWTCPGPMHAHGDRSPSLQVTRNNVGAGITCYTGCDKRDLLSILGLTMSDLFDEAIEPRREICQYDYHDLDGEVVYAKVRYAPKKFSMKHPSGNGWQPGIGNAPRVLYRFPQLIEGIASGKTVYIAEGEKDCDRLAKEGLVATTNFDGAGKWLPEYSSYFSGANVVIIADRDEPGFAHASLVKQNLHDYARGIDVLQSKTEGTGHDVSDHLDAGYSIQELVSVRPATTITRMYNPVDWFQVWKDAHEEPDWLFEPILEAGTVNALFGRPGVGKSLITLEMTMTIARGGRPVVYIDDENRIQDTVERLKAFSCRPEELDKLFMYSFAGLPALDTPEGGQHLAALADRHEAALVVLDTTSRMVGGDENAATTYLQLYRCALVPLKSRGVTVLRLDHPGKDDSRGQRGSSAKLGDIDTLWKLSSESEDLLTLEREKSRSGHGEPAITIRRLHNPLRHDWDALESLPVTGEVMGWAQKFDSWGAPRTAGRPTLRAILDEKGQRGCSNTTLSVVVRYRKKLGQALSVNVDAPPF
jgi:hypothetical protein